MLDVAPLAGHINIKACIQVVRYYSDVYNATENPFIICGGTVQTGNICGDIALPQRIEHGGVCCISLSFHFVHGHCFCVHEFPG